MRRNPKVDKPKFFGKSQALRRFKHKQAFAPDWSSSGQKCYESRKIKLNRGCRKISAPPSAPTPIQLLSAKMRLPSDTIVAQKSIGSRAPRDAEILVSNASHSKPGERFQGSKDSSCAHRRMPSHLEKDSVSSHTFLLRLGADRWLHMQFQELDRGPNVLIITSTSPHQMHAFPKSVRGENYPANNCFSMINPFQELHPVQNNPIQNASSKKRLRGLPRWSPTPTLLIYLATSKNECLASTTWFL